MTTMRDALEEMYFGQISEGRMKDIYQMQQDGKTAKEIAVELKLKVSTVKAILGEETILPESFNSTQLHNLKRQWAQVKTVNPEGETFRTMRKTIDKYPYEVLDQLAKNKINFVSYLAKKSLMDKHKMSLATVKKLYGGLLSNEYVPESTDMVTGRSSKKMSRGFTEPTPEETERHDCSKVHPKIKHKDWLNTEPVKTVKEGYEGTILAYLKKYVNNAHFKMRKLMVRKGAEGVVKTALQRGVADRASLIYTYELPPIIGEELEEGKSEFRLSYSDKYGKHAGFEDGKTLSDIQMKAQKLRAKGFKIDKMGRNTSPVKENIEVQVIKKGSGPEKNRSHIRDFNNKAEAEKWIKWYKTGKAKDTESIKMFDLSKTMKYMDNRPIDEKSPPGWEGTVRAMKKHPEINQDTKDKNIYALAWHMKNKGNKPHYKDKGGKPEKHKKYKDEGAKKTFERIWLQHKRGDKK